MHHANLLLGSKAATLAHLERALTTPHIDRVILEYDQIGIEEAHTLIGDASRVPVQGAYRAIIVTGRTITVPAQNALLKLFEEPAPTTRFFLCLPTDTLLPTLRSRLVCIFVDETVSSNEHGAHFLTLSYPERLAQIGALAKRKDDTALITLGRDVLALSQHVRDPDVLRDLMLVSTYLEMSGSSKKMLLEQLALTLPIAHKVR